VWVSWFDLKPKVDGLSMVWPQNHWVGFLGLTAKLRSTVSLGLTSKPVASSFPV
jgi:hypothetical protein